VLLAWCISVGGQVWRVAVWVVMRYLLLAPLP